MKIAFLGSPEIGAIVLRDLLRAGLMVEAIITRPDRPKGRSNKPEKTPVKVLGEANDIRIYEPNDKEELTRVVREIEPDIGIVAAYGMIIPDEALAIPKYGMINFHPSLLPELRGPSPIPMSIMCGYEKTGVSIIRVSPEMDAGDILLQEEVKLIDTETTPKLSEKLAHLGAKMIVKLLPDIEKEVINHQKQDEKKATYTKMIKKEDGEINWQEYEAKGVERAARAFTPWPGIYTHFKGKKLDLYDIKVIDNDIEPGKVTKIDNQILIGTKKDAIAPGAVKIEGKKRQDIRNFVCGYSDFVGGKLGKRD
ncbi:MAG: methionyl-tRNA formyltransferase [Patescibacteria group bacterium]|nr:methionyl-tRNA formyltransferase [Patescibacteria group bacterium]